MISRLSKRSNNKRLV